jgi:F-box protein 21
MNRLSFTLGSIDIFSMFCLPESLEMHPECCPITHPEVGKYFTSYEKTHYIPNTEKATEYPEDIELTEKLVHEHHHT